MSPFREPPGVELGPLEVGLGRAARRAMVGLIPSGGRLIAPDGYARLIQGEGGSFRWRSHAAGALGSLGLSLVAACAFVAATGGFRLSGVGATAATVALVIAGGLSLAAVLRALDAPRERLTVRGAVVGRAARRALRSALRLARQAARAPERFGPRRVAALRRTLSMLADPLIADWIPADVRGRAELLLARAIAASAGARWTRDASVRDEVRSLLRSAADHLIEPTPARLDLLTLAERTEAAPISREPRRQQRAPAAARSRRGAPSPEAPPGDDAADAASLAELDAADPAGGAGGRAMVRR
ncbi:hypothetical protein WMF26_03040 [Sorangium sp. So ce185]|uniref:hypothetical protein n=1 Tax=Sorangium sp. So ce185 TaxID=3133287 RepID=UPI003F616E51